MFLNHFLVFLVFYDIKVNIVGFWTVAQSKQDIWICQMWALGNCDGQTNASRIRKILCRLITNENNGQSHPYTKRSTQLCSLP